MTVVIVSDCPPRLRGDLTKWLLEINTGVYVGKLNARVRDELWDRICENLRHGRATRVYNTNNEQRMDFRVHNAAWEPVDYDGIKLVRRPAPRAPGASGTEKKELLAPGFSKAAHRQMARHAAGGAAKRKALTDYCAFDLETTGLDSDCDRIIEFGAVRVRDGTPGETFSVLVRCGVPLPEPVKNLTGLTDAQLNQEGIELKPALEQFLAFVGSDPLLCHNAAFDLAFLNEACRTCRIPIPQNSVTDTLPIARRRLRGAPDYKLETLAQTFHLDSAQCHRALPDSLLTCGIYSNLNEL